MALKEQNVSFYDNSRQVATLKLAAKEPPISPTSPKADNLSDVTADLQYMLNKISIGEFTMGPEISQRTSGQNLETVQSEY